MKNHKLILLTFYSTTCGYSKKQMPNLIEAYKRYENDVAIILSESTYSSYTDIENFIISNKLPDNFYYVSDRKMHNGSSYFMPLFRVKIIQETYLLTVMVLKFTIHG